MSTAGANGAAFNASAEVGPPAAVGSSQLADALAELEAAEARVVKVEETLTVVRASRKAAAAAVAALQRKGE